MPKTIHPVILILSSKFDISCDYVTAKLSNWGVPYLRLNSEDLPTLKLRLNPIRAELSVTDGATHFIMNSETLRSIYYRRPVFLREYGVPFAIREQHSRVQWAAFERNLMIFQDSFWMNHPGATYIAEHKAVQLNAATKLGFNVPPTFVQNSADGLERLFKSDKFVVIKGLDTCTRQIRKKEIFGFTRAVLRSDLIEGTLNSAPLTIQRFFSNKLDIRVTVVQKELFAVKITNNGHNIYGDWRLLKNNASFQQIVLPNKIGTLCVKLVKKLQLTYGAIDLVLQDGKYYFLEINPTGEWAWLVDSANLPIDEAIAERLIK